MTVETAQRRLLEALAQLHRAGADGDGGDPLAALCLGLDIARHLEAGDVADDPLGPVLAALQDLTLAVRADLAEAGTGVAWTP